MAEKNETAPPQRLVLIVEDSEDIRDSISGLLTGQGFSTAFAIDGASALSCLSNGLRPDLILLDMTMEGMDGAEFRKHQLRNPLIARIPVLLMTALRNVDLKALSLTRVLLKPFTVEALLREVRGALTPDVLAPAPA
jgi:CheY-like chemotaxis protein